MTTTESIIEANIKNLEALVNRAEGDYVEYDVKKGKASAQRLWASPDVGVILGHLDKGTEFELHTHIIKEIGIVVKGEVQVDIIYKTGKKETKILKPKDIFVFDPETMKLHNQICNEQAQIVFVSIPKEGGY